MPFKGWETEPRGLRGSSAKVLSTIAVVGALVLASVPGGALASPRARFDSSPTPAGSKPPKNKPPVCPPTNPKDPAFQFSYRFPGGPSPYGDACGTRHDDSMKIADLGGGGTEIWAGPGNDNVNAQNNKVDELWGGAGQNSATIDSCLPDGKISDHTIDFRSVKAKKVKCTGVSHTSLFAADAAITYPYQEPDILCTVSNTGKRFISIAREPTMRAVDATANVDWETVAFTALLYKWNGSTYVFSGDQSPWMMDRVPDEQLLDFGPNFWRPAGSTTHQSIYFEPTSAGRYRVAIEYHWYAANGNPSQDKDILDWASYHFGHYGSPGEGYCNFPGPPPPDGDYAGLSDEGVAVSFNAAPIWSDVPRVIGGSRLTKVKFGTSVTCTPTLTFVEPLTIDPGRWIQLGADNTFAYARVGGLTSTARQNETGSYFFTGKIDTSGNAAGSAYIQQLSFDLNGTHYDCTGKAHSWTAKVAG